jgi:hypothetical protein
MEIQALVLYQAMEERFTYALVPHSDQLAKASLNFT